MSLSTRAATAKQRPSKHASKPTNNNNISNNE